MVSDEEALRIGRELAKIAASPPSVSECRPFVERLDVAPADQFEMFGCDAEARPLCARNAESDSFLQDFIYVYEGFKRLLPHIILQAPPLDIGNRLCR